MKFSAPASRWAHFPPFQPIGWIVSVMSRIYGWTVDRRREVRIRDLRLRMSVAYAVRDHLSVAAIGREMFAECDARSPAQVRRMEKRLFDSLDPHARAVFERATRQ